MIHIFIEGLDDDNTIRMVLMITTRLPRVLTMIANLLRVLKKITKLPRALTNITTVRKDFVTNSSH